MYMSFQYGLEPDPNQADIIRFRSDTGKKYYNSIIKNFVRNA